MALQSSVILTRMVIFHELGFYTQGFVSLYIFFTLAICSSFIYLFFIICYIFLLISTKAVFRSKTFYTLFFSLFVFNFSYKILFLIYVHHLLGAFLLETLPSELTVFLLCQSFLSIFWPQTLHSHFAPSHS